MYRTFPLLQPRFEAERLYHGPSGITTKGLHAKSRLQEDDSQSRKLTYGGGSTILFYWIPVLLCTRSQPFG
jgi:hypothetical protein